MSTPTSPSLIGCPYCDAGRYSPEYLPRHIGLNHPDAVPPPDPLTGDEPECCRCRDHHDPMRNCTDCAWCMNGCPMPWPTPADGELCKGCDGQ